MSKPVVATRGRDSINNAAVRKFIEVSFRTTMRCRRDESTPVISSQSRDSSRSCTQWITGGRDAAAHLRTLGRFLVCWLFRATKIFNASEALVKFSLHFFRSFWCQKSCNNPKVRQQAEQVHEPMLVQGALSKELQRHLSRLSSNYILLR